MNVLFLIGTVLGVGALALGALAMLLAGARLKAGVLGAIGAGWTVVYLAMVIGASLLSHDQVLAQADTKRFCGFYFDCHVGVSVVGDSAAFTHAGVIHLVTLRFSSTAARETLTPWQVETFIQGGDGSRYPGEPAGRAEMERPIPAGGAYDVVVRFEVPRSLSVSRLMVRQGGDFLFPEVLLIGDEASLLHRKTWLALPA
ncbi:MAG TPA: hypothetical protein VGI92_03335 [Gemmatimonadales bacterium]|jgi:hypothetical protein